jgi:hypothetical protein
MSEYRDPQQSRIEFGEECFIQPRMCYNMFRMSVEVFMSLHDVLVST